MDFVALEMINILVFRAQRGQRSSSAPVREEKHVFASKNSRHTLLILLKQQGQKQMAFAFPLSVKRPKTRHAKAKSARNQSNKY